MPLPIKEPIEVFRGTRRTIVTNRFKGLPREIDVRVKEHGCPRVTHSIVHIVFESDKPISIFYSQLSTDDVIKPQTKCKSEKRKLEKKQNSL